MKFIILALICCALLGYATCDMPCKVYTNMTLIGGLCPTPNYKIAPLAEYLNETRKDDVSLEIQRYYNQVSDSVKKMLVYVPDFMKTSSCWSQVNNLACGSILRHCDVAAIPDLSSPVPPTSFKIDPASIGFAACEDQLSGVIETCTNSYTQFIPVLGKVLQNWAKAYVLEAVRSSNLDFQGIKFKVLDNTVNCTRYTMHSGAIQTSVSFVVIAVLAALML